MNAFNEGDYTYSTDAGTVSVHVPEDIDTTSISRAVAKLAAAKQSENKPQAA